jgi:protein tyrosine/serine phosphatase
MQRDKMKGFGGILILLTVFVVAVFLLSINHTTSQENSLKGEVYQSKIILTNYEIILNAATLDCNWKKIDVNTCIDSNANTLLSKENSIQNLLTCNKTGINTTLVQKEYYFDLNCTSSLSTPENDTQLTLKKRITIKKF